EEGKQFCPYCGKPAGGQVVEAHRMPVGAESDATARAARDRPMPPRPAPMSDFGAGRGGGDADNSRRAIYLVVAVVALALTALLIYLAARPSAAPAEPRLEGAIRADSPEFAQVRERLVVEFDADQNASESPRAIGDIVMFLEPTLRNHTGRTVESVELRAAVVDLEGRPVKQRTVVREINLEPNKVMKVPFNIDGFKSSDVRANATVELTAAKFK
ncbi:MAG TPA: hypothetical protein VE360_18890, partial [Pyrinomonadaceae bacterium]|nr:hypothetical protein [Pyrinomonadaceae bacterium]